MFKQIRNWWNGMGERPGSVVRPQARPRLESLEERTPAATLYAVDFFNRALLQFDSANPNNVTNRVAVQVNSDELVVGIDFRPRTGQLFGLAVDTFATNSNARLLRINPLTGETVQVGASFVVFPSSPDYGFDFNPTVDRLRVVTNSNENFRINPNDGSVIEDTLLNPSPVVGISDVAYDRNFDGRLGSAGTTLYTIDVEGLNQARLRTIGGPNQGPSPNTGILFDIPGGGNLGVPIGNTSFISAVGFDIPASAQAMGNGFAVFDSNADDAIVNTGLYNINLATGAATFIGPVDFGLPDLFGLTTTPESNLFVGLPGGGVTDALMLTLDSNTNNATLPPIAPFPGYFGQLIIGAGDFNRDTIPDAVVSAATSQGAVKVFNGATGAELFSTLAFEGFNGTISVACGDVDGDGFHDAIVTANGANGHIKAFSGRNGSLISSFFGLPGYLGQTSLTSADFNNDGRDEIVLGAGARGLNGRIGIFNFDATAFNGGFNTFQNFDGILSLAAGDYDGDGTPEVVVGAVGSSNGHIMAFNGLTGAPVTSFFTATGSPSGVFDPFNFEVGIGAFGRNAIGMADVNRDGRFEIRVAQPNQAFTLVRSFDFNVGLVNTIVVTDNKLGAALAGARV